MTMKRQARGGRCLEVVCVVGAGVVLAGALAAGAPVAAQDTAETPTTTEPTRPTLLPRPETTTTTSAEQPPPPPPPPDGQAPTDDGASEAVPQDPVVVPPPDSPPPPDPTAPILQQVAQLNLAEVMESFRQAQEAQAQAATTLGSLTGELQALEARLNQLEAEKADAVARLQKARSQLKRRAVAGYMGSPASPLNRVLGAEDFNDLTRRYELVTAVVDADRARVDEYQAARRAVTDELEEVVAALDARRASQLVATSVLDGADSALLAKQIQLAAVQAGGGIVGAGFVFPVGGPHSYSDTFGAPRMFGTSYAHLHQGTDIFAAHGTPLLACERGVLIKVGSDTLGGTKLWLVGASGTRYYYAHLSAFAEGVTEGKVVRAGDVIGFVGNTGNAATTPAHLHFEVHPNGGPAVNPYPLLRIVDEAQARFRQPSPASSAPRS
ncbi:MAG TPA: peptidoglycan DD-metalloendopeptidase family protein [Acidimicrobiales bacterium]|nr:peptidoglycan DD-metalloendopeptidase family protein [Acidimicrobiales bacterium]